MTPFNDPIYSTLPDALVNPQEVLMAIPCHDRRCDCGTINSALNVLPHLARNPFFIIGNSDICLTRNIIAHKFMEHSPYEWLVMVDSDIIFSVDDWMYLWEGSEEIVTAPYARKIMGEQPVKFGLGFTRVHRSAFEKIKNQLDPHQMELAQRFYQLGEQMANYYPIGVTMGADYHGEDRGFFLLSKLSGCSLRLEERTRLKHVGSFEYGYPDQCQDRGIPITGAKTFAAEDGAN